MRLATFADSWMVIRMKRHQFTGIIRLRATDSANTRKSCSNWEINIDLWVTRTRRNRTQYDSIYIYRMGICKVWSWLTVTLVDPPAVGKCCTPPKKREFFQSVFFLALSFFSVTVVFFGADTDWPDLSTELTVWGRKRVSRWRMKFAKWWKLVAT